MREADARSEQRQVTDWTEEEEESCHGLTT